LAETKSQLPIRVVRFGVFQINIAARELRKHGVRIRLPGQPFCILSMLLEKPGEILTRDEIRRRLWASDTFVDFEHSMNSAIKKLRAALGDTPENSRYIETIPRIGYRFIAPVEVVPAAPPTGDAESAVKGTALPGAVKKIGEREWKALVAMAILLAVAAGFYFKWPRSQSQARTQSKSAGEIHGGVGSRDPTRPNIQPVSPAKSAEAHDLYLKGMYFWNKRTGEDLRQAIEYFQRATKADPNYVLAYAGLANSYTLLTAYTGVSASLYMPQARAAAAKALELDGNLAEAHTALALIAQNQDWDWRTSEKEYKRAIELNPNYATAHHWYAEHLMWMGRFDEALKESDKARQLDPLSLIIATDHGAILYFSRQYDGAIEQFRSVLQKEPNFDRAAAMIICAYVEKKKFAQALTEVQIVRRLYGEGPWYWSWRAYIYGRAGQIERARREVEKLENVSRHEKREVATMLWAHLGMGNKEEALADLEKAYSEHINILTLLKVEPGFDPLRSDPRFQDLLKRVGLSE